MIGHPDIDDAISMGARVGRALALGHMSVSQARRTVALLASEAMRSYQETRDEMPRRLAKERG